MRSLSHNNHLLNHSPVGEPLQSYHRPHQQYFLEFPRRLSRSFEIVENASDSGNYQLHNCTELMIS
jgi:hypothetical protein